MKPRCSTPLFVCVLNFMTTIKFSAVHAKKIILWSWIELALILGLCPPSAGAGLCVRARFFPPLYLDCGSGSPFFGHYIFGFIQTGWVSDGFCLWNKKPTHPTQKGVAALVCICWRGRHRQPWRRLLRYHEDRSKTLPLVVGWICEGVVPSVRCYERKGVSHL